MRIGEVARQAGVSVRALRYYEEHGLLDADRSPGGQRHYPADAVGRVALIRLLYAAGLPSRTVRDVLQCVDSGTVPPALLERLLSERARIDQQITDLISARDRLDRVIDATRHPDPNCVKYPDPGTPVPRRPTAGPGRALRSA